MAPRAVAALWSRFSHLYGHRWESTYGPALNDRDEMQPIAATWAKALAGFGPEDLARGLHGCLDREDGWPPTLPEFRALCREPQPTAPYHVPFPHRARLESDELKARRRSAAQRALGEIRTHLGMGAPA